MKLLILLLLISCGKPATETTVKHVPAPELELKLEQRLVELEAAKEELYAATIANEAETEALEQLIVELEERVSQLEESLEEGCEKKKGCK